MAAVAGVSVGLSASFDGTSAGVASPAWAPVSRAVLSGQGSRPKVPARQPGRPTARQVSPNSPRSHATQHRAAGRHAARTVSHARPYLIFDSATPTAIPPHHEIATYADGPHPVPPSEVAGRAHVLWIDINGTDPQAAVLDVEPGCATPSTVPVWVWHRLTAEPHGVAIIYTMRSEWPAVQAAVATLPARMRSRVRWWIADPTGYPHLVPGSDATQWYWGPSYDISTATPRLQQGSPQAAIAG
jgi:hypothetical protein